MLPHFWSWQGGGPPQDMEAPRQGEGLFGRHHHGPFGGRRRGARMFDSGALRLVVLGLIAEAPRHGYDIIHSLRARFQGSYSPSPGAIYPMLRLLSEAGLVTSTSWGPKRRFEITDQGRAYLAEHADELEKINAQIKDSAAPMLQSAIGEAIQAFRATLIAKMRQGSLSAEQAEKLKDVLVKARDEIERI